ncbi:hypothetical protein R5R35_011007 [Gryllus longicercus]|uniref:Uncharacterized protein n=2 Tax=Gryllus longicercus TaxID=2509291 RepID=A0AAN9Z4V9_9ORTH
MAKVTVDCCQGRGLKRKPALKIKQSNEKPEEKGLNWHFGSRRRVSSFERKNGEIYKIPDLAAKGKVSLSNMKRPQTVISRNMPKPFSAQSQIRSSSNRISSLSRLQKSSDTVVIPCWRATNSPNFTNANRLARPSRSVTGASSGLRSDKTPEKSLRRPPGHPFETESSPNVLDKKTFPRYTSMNNVESNTEKSELITLLEPQSTSKGWRGNTKTRIEKLPFKKPKPEPDLESSNVNNQVARPHTSPKYHVFTRTETNKLHPGTMNANKQIAMIYKDKFDPALLDRFRFRNVTTNKYSNPSNFKTMMPQASSASRPTTSSFPKTAPLAKKQSFTSSAVVKALEIRNNLNFMKKAPTFSPGGRRDSFVVRPVTTARHAQSASGWVPFIRPPLVSTKPKTDKGFQNPETKENIDKSISIPRRPLRQWKEKAEKWTDSVTRRPERDPRGRYDKLSMSSFKRKASEKFEVPNTSKTDNGAGSSIGGSRDGRKNIPLTEKASSSLRNVGTRKFQVSLKTSRHRPGYYRW